MNQHSIAKPHIHIIDNHQYILLAITQTLPSNEHYDSFKLIMSSTWLWALCNDGSVPISYIQGVASASQNSTIEITQQFGCVASVTHKARIQHVDKQITWIFIGVSFQWRISAVLVALVINAIAHWPFISPAFLQMITSAFLPWRPICVLLCNANVKACMPNYPYERVPIYD